ncbi:hypothetical protein V8E55_007932 [Tylopilus felleus]
MASTQQTPALFKPIKVGRITLQHRVVLAPLTLYQAYALHVPGPQHASFYSLRGSTAGNLLITEATLISHDAGGEGHAPGVYTDAQIQGWKKVTDAVHAKGSYIFLQLWAPGRATDAGLLEKQDSPSPYVSTSSVVMTGQSKSPHPLTEEEVKYYIAAYAKAASNAVHSAGFDGVEIHSGYGHLLDQFLQTEFNKPSDRRGGDEEARTRFVREVVDAVVDAVGEDRVGIRISPWNTFQGMKMPDPRPTFAYLVTALRDKHPRMAYLHVIEPHAVRDINVAQIPDENNDFLREIWNGGQGGEERIFISAGGYIRSTALHTAENKGGLIAFGRLYLSNPDLPVRLRKDLPLSPGTSQPPRGDTDGNVRGIGGKL